jgi:hypothetical protein
MSSRELTELVWEFLGATVAALLIGSALSNGRLPTLAAFTGRLVARRSGRALLVIGWMWLGWHAFAR